jgi:Ca2+-binding EF-hand superfamily protein
MRRFWRKQSGLAGLVGAMLAGVTPAMSQQPPSPAPVVMSPGTLLLLSHLQNGPLDRYLGTLRQDFFQIDADGDGKITQGDADLHTLMEGIQLRTFGVTFVMRYDLDGDGFVTEDEIRRTTSYDMRVQRASNAYNNAGKPTASGIDINATQIDGVVKSIMALDADKDGKVSLAEATRYVMPGMQRGLAGNGQSERARQALTLDTATKGQVTLADFEAAGEALFHKVDADQDGEISRQELIDYRRQPDAPDPAARIAAAQNAQKRAQERADATKKEDQEAEVARAACTMPTASENAKVVLLSAYQTDALSSATIGSQDTVVHAGRVTVEPGSEPLYVVIATYGPTIWQFTGAVERVERVVMTSSQTGPSQWNAQQPSLVGATGIAQDRIRFLGRSNCLSYFAETPSSASLQASAAVRQATGKAPDVISAKYSVGSYSIPSGNIETLNDRGQQPLIIQKSGGSLNIIGNTGNVIIQSGPSQARDEMKRFFPGGVIDIDPKTVVASAPVAAYEVLPAQAGLVQLLGSGALTQNRSGEYIVRDKIRFPAGLTGAHAVTFLVMKGAPYPDGDPGHSCVVSEDSGDSKGAGCRTR